MQLVQPEILPTELVAVLNETIIINSSSSLSGNSRNGIEIIFPPKARSYIYRISVFSKRKRLNMPSLLDQLQHGHTTNTINKTTKLKGQSKVDAFIFNNIYDADNFITKNDWNWNSHKQLRHTSHRCDEIKDSIPKKIYFGFKNNNLIHGVAIRLEIVAVIDSQLTADYKNSYSVLNESGMAIKYLFSPDNSNWNEQQIPDGCIENYMLEQKEIFIKIPSSESTEPYKIFANDRYKITKNKDMPKLSVIRY